MELSFRGVLDHGLLNSWLAVAKPLVAATVAMIGIFRLKLLLNHKRIRRPGLRRIQQAALVGHPRLSLQQIRWHALCLTISGARLGLWSRHDRNGGALEVGLGPLLPELAAIRHAQILGAIGRILPENAIADLHRLLLVQGLRFLEEVLVLNVLTLLDGARLAAHHEVSL